MARLLLGLAAMAVAAAGPSPPGHEPPRRAPHVAAPKPEATRAAGNPPTPASTPDGAAAGDPGLRRCRDLLAPVSPSESPPGPASVEATGPDECRFRNIRLGLGGFLGYRMDALLVRGIPFERPRGPLAPVHARLEARGITLSLRDQPPKLAWLSRQQQAPFDLVLDVAYDPATTLLTLNDLAMDGEELGHVGLRARLENVHLVTTRPGGVPEAENLPGIRSLHVELDSRTFLVSYVLPLLLNLLPDDDPDAAYQAGRAGVIAAIRALLPASGAPAGAASALAALAADFLRPRHPFVLDVQASTPVTPEAVLSAVDDPARLPALLRVLAVTAAYEGTLR